MLWMQHSRSEHAATSSKAATSALETVLNAHVAAHSTQCRTHPEVHDMLCIASHAQVPLSLVAGRTCSPPGCRPAASAGSPAADEYRPALEPDASPAAASAPGAGLPFADQQSQLPWPCFCPLRVCCCRGLHQLSAGRRWQAGRRGEALFLARVQRDACLVLQQSQSLASPALLVHLPLGHLVCDGVLKLFDLSTQLIHHLGVDKDVRIVQVLQ